MCNTMKEWTGERGCQQSEIRQHAKDVSIAGVATLDEQIFDHPSCRIIGLASGGEINHSPI